MKIAIVAPSPVPYTVGGAEKLWWGLLNALNQTTSHQIELIKLPSPERNFWELMASYQMFSELNLDHFDRIISTKYPAWMVVHANHHCYLQHKLRGLYDTYHFCKKPTTLPKSLPAPLHRLKAIISGAPSRESLPELFAELAEINMLAEVESEVAEIMAFPGPVSRAVVHYLDNVALNAQAIQRFSAISRNVAGRTDYFPPEVPVEVIHHPSDVTRYQQGGYDYVFTISRLDGAKRIRLLIEAFMATQTERTFRIAGTGPEEAELKQLAAADPRIQFLGRITDDEVLKHYAGALFIPFIPYDEDYGLITIEAMSSGKAVLTTTDAGGVNEFVENGVSGWSVEPSVEALTAGMQKMLDHPEQTRTMGEQAKQKVAHISWRDTVQRLLGERLVNELRADAPSSNPKGPLKQRPNIVVAVNFAVYPPQGGGQSRVFHLYLALSQFADVTLVTQCAAESDAGTFQLAPGYREIRVAKSEAQRQHERTQATMLKASVDDIAAIDGVLQTPNYLTALQQQAQEADLVIASHPYLFKAIAQVYQGELWYEAHNVEYDMKSAVLEHASPVVGEEQQAALACVAQVESGCIEASSTVLACSDQDVRRLGELYPAMRDKSAVVVPNGVCLASTPFASWAERTALQQRLGTSERFQAVFIGSWHGPNIEAMEWTLRYAKECPEADFLIVGSVCRHPVCKSVSSNVHLLGLVSDQEKSVLLNSVDLAINPMTSGSGTNLKMLDYAAAGTPILSTEFGNRGLVFEPEEDLLIAPVEAFGKVIRQLAQEKREAGIRTQQTSPEQKVLPDQKGSPEQRVAAAYQRCKAYYDWQVIAGNLADIVKRQCGVHS